MRMDHDRHSSLDSACGVDRWVILRETVKIADHVWCTGAPTLHRELGHSDIRGLVDSLGERKINPTVLPAPKLMKCDACQANARLSLGPTACGRLAEPGAVLQLNHI